MDVIKVNCEWDIGCNEALWLTLEAARRDVEKALKDCGIDDPMEELEGHGYVSFEYVTVRS